MSLKVYTAYRLRKSSDLWPFIHDTRVKAEKNCKAVLKELYLSGMDQVDTNADDYKKELAFAGDEKRARLTIVRRDVRQGYYDQLQSSERDIFHFDVSITFHQHKGRLYVLPYCDMLMRKVLDFLKKDKRLEDFCYWNNTDPLEGVSDRQWKARGRVWDAITDNWDDMLCVDILDKSRFLSIDPWLETQRELSKK